MNTGPAMLKPGDKPDNYSLTGCLDFASVSPLLQQGYDWLGSGAQVQVDLSGVSHCNSAAIGLLLEWLRQARLRKTGIRFRNIPKALLEIARVSDIQDLLTA
jgi:phospholipid transport system transporter-binding protein